VAAVYTYLIHPLAPEQKSKPFYDSCHKRTLDGLTRKIISLYLSISLNKDGASVKFNDDDASHD
jgi:hypothetical protein